MTAERGFRTLLEINNQPEAWRATFETTVAHKADLLVLARDVEDVVFAGCGSARNAGVSLSTTFQHFTGIRSRSVPSAELSHFPETILPDKSTGALVVAITRSGETTETLEACQAAQSRGARTLAITCHEGSSLTTLADDSIILAAAGENSIVTTQSLTSMVLCGQVFGALVAGDRVALDGLS